jgi:hypothetical protein
LSIIVAKVICDLYYKCVTVVIYASICSSPLLS